MNNKLQPHNVEAEEAVLGSLLIDPDAVIRVTTILQAADFFIDRHTWIYEVICDLHERRQPADLVTVCDELERRNRLEEMGGSARITELINATPTSIHAEFYAGIVKRTATLRRLIDAAGQVARLAHSNEDDLAEIINRAEEIIFGVTSSSSIRAGVARVGALLNDYVDQVEYLHQHHGNLVGLPTGLTDLDKLMGGLQRTDMILLAGRPGKGKTSLALSIALHNARRFQKRIAIFSLEMSQRQLVEKFVASLSSIDSQRLRKGDIKENEWPRFTGAIDELARMPIFIDDTPAISASELRAKARRLHSEIGLDLLIVDYLQLMRGDSKSENRQQEVSYISRSIKALARELKIPVLALSQLNRDVESRHDKRPQLADLRESGSLEQDSDVVMFVFQENEDYPNVVTLDLQKHRSGPTGIFSVYFKKPICQFVDLEVRRADFAPIPNGSMTHVGNGAATFAAHSVKENGHKENSTSVEKNGFSREKQL
jgi:replicative DNA helicase